MVSLEIGEREKRGKKKTLRETKRGEKIQSANVVKTMGGQLDRFSSKISIFCYVNEDIV